MIGMQAALTIPLALIVIAPSSVEAQRKNRTVKRDSGRRIAAIAKNATARPIRLSRRDCSGFVETVLARAGVPRRGNTRSFYFDAVRERRLHFGRARPGDLVFFDRTYDRNRNGRIDDPLTHIAIVTAVQRDGTIVMAHRGNSGIRTLRMNVKKPAIHRSRDGRVLNDFLAEPGYGRKRLAGQVFRAFARPPRR